MLENMMEELEHWNQKTRLLDRLEENYPLLSLLLFQILAGVLMVAVVSGIAFTGGVLIWMFDRMISLL